ncbi:MAG TPA: FtsQ-type POTRA domain-containing protein [Firmicutes bacterium]|nr:FtsQ-type POTRA domain-containing protein [Bacillota bacterium]
MRAEMGSSTGNARRRLKRRGFVPFLLMMTAVLACLAVIRSPYFTVTRIAVEGTSSLKSDEIILMSGLVCGRNIFELDPVRATRRLLSNPKIESARVVRRFPSTIVIHVRERRAVGVVPYSGYFVEIDDLGRAICIREAYDNDKLPIITGVGARGVRVGEPVDAVRLQPALWLAALLDDRLRSRISEIHVDTDMSLVLFTEDRIKVIMGRDNTRETLNEKMRVLEAVLDRLANEGEAVQYIDLRSEKQPVVKMKTQ